MNRNLFEKSLINLLVVVAWLSEAVIYQFDIHKIAAIMIAFICAVLISVEKKPLTRFFIIVIVGVAIALCNLNCLFYGAPALLVFLAHKEETDTVHKEVPGKKRAKNNESMKGTYLTFAFMLMVAGLIYAFLNLPEYRIDYIDRMKKISGEFILLFTVVLSVLISSVYKSKKKCNHREADFKSVYIMGLIGITEAAAISIVLENSVAVVGRYALVFWLIVIILLIGNGDSNANILSEKIKAFLERAK